jgi:hypothetical protein
MSQKSATTAVDGHIAKSSKTKGHGRQQAKSAGPLSEEELRRQQYITPEDVLRLEKATKDYLCSPAANVYGIDFMRFKIRDVESGATLFEVTKSDDEEGEDTPSEPPRYVKYHFPPQFLKLKRVGATVEFTVGGSEVRQLRMVERHYFKEKLLKSFDFDFGFCMPYSRNSCEHIYEMPELTPEEGQQKLYSTIRPFTPLVCLIIIRKKLSFFNPLPR